MKPLTALASVLDSAVLFADESGKVMESNPIFTQLMRCVSGDDWRLHVDQGDRALVDSFWASIFNPTAEEEQAAILHFHLAGVEGRFQMRAQAVTEDDAIVGAVATIEREQSTVTPRWRTDAVTGLPETEAVLGRFEEYIESGRAFGGAVVLLDDTQAADDVSRKEAARQLLTTIRPTDLLTSSTDGRFVLCAAGIDSETAALAMADRILGALNSSSLTARIGLVLPDRDDAVPATLLREAEAGAYASEWGSYSFAPE